MAAGTVVVDASFALKLVLPEKESPLVQSRFNQWFSEKTLVAAPWLFPFECQGVLRRKVFLKQLTAAEGSRLWRALWNIGIELRHADGLWERAWRLAELHQRPTTYDSSYLALAELLDAELWTCDHRFAQAIGPNPRIKTLPPD